MTPYILILLYILNPNHFRVLIIDRVIDTAIGSAIALMANILFSPEWAYKQFGEYLQKMLEANKNYFSDVSSFFTGQAVPVNTYKLSRKEAYVALANISDALNKMTAEPKSKQKNAADISRARCFELYDVDTYCNTCQFCFCQIPSGTWIRNTCLSYEQ